MLKPLFSCQTHSMSLQHDHNYDQQVKDIRFEIDYSPKTHCAAMSWLVDHSYDHAIKTCCAVYS